MIDRPRITIALTAYNAEKTISAALSSALAQDWPHCDILVYDDASQDKTTEIVQATMRDHPNIRLICGRANRGVGFARNQLVAAAEGDVIAFFDDDDTSSPDRVRKQWERLQQVETETGSDSVLCHTARLQHYPNGYRRYEATMGMPPHSPPQGAAVADRILYGRLSPGVVGSVATCSQMARTVLYRRLGGFDADLSRGEDTDLAIRHGLAGGVMAGLAEPLVNQTMTPGNEKRLDAELHSYRTITEKHRDYLEHLGWYRFCQHWLTARAASLQGNRLELLRLLALLAFRHPVKLLKKIRWVMPARQTRRDFNRWHRGQLGGPVGEAS